MADAFESMHNGDKDMYITLTLAQAQAKIEGDLARSRIGLKRA